jgi:citrate lyase beta subunit
MPGNEMRKIRKAITLGVDCICMDMEDGVALTRKEEARATIAGALRDLDFDGAERLVRINPPGSGLEIDDLNALLPARPDGVVIPKVEIGEQVRWVGDRIGEIEDENGWPKGAIRLIVLIETARSVVNLSQIASSDPRLEALIFGADDFAGDIGATRTRQGAEVFYARSAVATHAAAFGLQAIDMVYIDLHDSEGLRCEAEEGARLGFAGKQVIHPDQVGPVQRAFTPDDRAIAEALRLVQAYQQHQEAGIGAFAMEGRMVDAPLIRAAERILALARAAGKIK